MNKYKALGLVILVVAVVTPSVFAATPSNGTLAAPAAGQTTSVPFSGGPFTGVTATPAACTTLNCDTFTLIVNVPASFYSANPTYAVHVRIDWGSNTNDFDLNVNDASGNTVCNSGQGQTTFEDADCGQLASGTYMVQVVGFVVANATYSGAAKLAPEPAAGTGNARYRKSNLIFSAPQELQRPINLANNGGTGLTADQDVEPRIVHDVLGNYYVAAIQGVPGGIDVWKSSDSGHSFTYLGQPDGLQIGAALGADGVGLGGGDEDIAVSPSGVVYASSLWLGSATQSSSFTGGTTWLSNPISSDRCGTGYPFRGRSPLVLNDFELGAVPALGRELDVDLLRDRKEGLRGLVVGMGHDDRPALVAPGAELGHERHLAEQRHVELRGELRAAAFAEEVVSRVVVAAEPRHVLDHADHLQVDFRAPCTRRAARPSARRAAAS